MCLTGGEGGRGAKPKITVTRKVEAIESKNYQQLDQNTFWLHILKCFLSLEYYFPWKNNNNLSSNILVWNSNSIEECKHWVYAGNTFTKLMSNEYGLPSFRPGDE